MCFCWLALRAVAGLARPLAAFAAVLCCCPCCCARRLPTLSAAANAAVLLLLPLLAVLWAGVGRSSVLGVTLVLLLGRVPFPAPCLHGDLRDDNTLFEV